MLMVIVPFFFHHVFAILTCVRNLTNECPYIGVWQWEPFVAELGHILSTSVSSVMDEAFGTDLFNMKVFR